MSNDTDRPWYTILYQALVSTPSPLPSGLLRYVQQGSKEAVQAAVEALRASRVLDRKDRALLAEVVLDTQYDLHMLPPPEPLADYLIHEVSEGRSPSEVWAETRVQRYVDSMDTGFFDVLSLIRPTPQYPLLLGLVDVISDVSLLDAVREAGWDSVRLMARLSHLWGQSSNVRRRGELAGLAGQVAEDWEHLAPPGRDAQDLWSQVTSEEFMLAALALMCPAPARAGASALRRILPGWLEQHPQDEIYLGCLELVVSGVVAACSDDLLTSTARLLERLPAVAAALPQTHTLVLAELRARQDRNQELGASPVVRSRVSCHTTFQDLAGWFVKNLPDDPVAWYTTAELWPSSEDEYTRPVDLTVAVQQMLQPSRT